MPTVSKQIQSVAALIASIAALLGAMSSHCAVRQERVVQEASYDELRHALRDCHADHGHHEPPEQRVIRQRIQEKR